MVEFGPPHAATLLRQPRRLSLLVWLALAVGAVVLAVHLGGASASVRGVPPDGLARTLAQPAQARAQPAQARARPAQARAIRAGGDQSQGVPAEYGAIRPAGPRDVAPPIGPTETWPAQ